MFHIESLKIDGIKSFPEGNHHPGISFNSNKNRITLIQGDNGTGKTTILEVLKFALTGIYPGSPDKSVSFIRDRIVDRSTSFADRGSFGKIQVCLIQNGPPKIEWTINWEMKRKAGSKNMQEPYCTITRGMEIVFSGIRTDFVSQHKTNVVFGISPAAWENIIMVPQEEVLWAFSTPGQLKTQFDKLFSIEDKNERLKSLSKSKEEISTEVQILHPQLGPLALLSGEYQAKNEELGNKLERQRELEQNLSELSQNVEPLHLNVTEIAEANTLLERIQKNKGWVTANLSPDTVRKMVIVAHSNRRQYWIQYTPPLHSK